MPPLPGSPAIDASGTTSLATDQRGFTITDTNPLPGGGFYRLEARSGP